MNINQRSMLEVAIDLMGKKKKPQKAIDMIKETLEIKGIDDATGSLAAQLYIDITTSALFVYCGEGQWDLKKRQDIALWDKDGSFFSNGIIEDEEDEVVTSVDDYEIVDEDEEVVTITEEDEDEEVVIANDEDEEIDLDEKFIPYSSDYDDDTEITDSFLDEDKYNDYMDDYEDLYDDK